MAALPAQTEECQALVRRNTAIIVGMTTITTPSANTKDKPSAPSVSDFIMDRIAGGMATSIHGKARKRRVPLTQTRSAKKHISQRCNPRMRR